jgi:hypothetical protein
MAFLTTPVPMWAIIVALVVGAVLAAAVSRKYGNAWLAVIGQAFTIKDVKLLAGFIWQANILPKWLMNVRFGGDQERFAQYVANIVLGLLPEIGRLDEVALNMTQGGLRSFGTQIELEGRGKYRFRPPDIQESRGSDLVKG